MIIWFITAIATSSTISGINVGIRRLSEVALGIGAFIMMIILCLDKTSFLMNLYIQSIGVYFQNIIQVGWNTDAFEQLGPSYGQLDRQRHIPNGFENTDGPKDWINMWTMFWWGLWICYCPLTCKFNFIVFKFVYFLNVSSLTTLKW